jgi:hypothetical protein
VIPPRLSIVPLRLGNKRVAAQPETGKQQQDRIITPSGSRRWSQLASSRVTPAGSSRPAAARPGTAGRPLASGAAVTPATCGYRSSEARAVTVMLSDGVLAWPDIATRNALTSAARMPPSPPGRAGTARQNDRAIRAYLATVVATRH